MVNGIPCEALNGTLMHKCYGIECKQGLVFALLIQMNVAIRCPKHKCMFVSELNPSETQDETSRGDAKFLHHFPQCKIPEDNVAVIA